MTIKEMVSFTGESYMLRQLAEECCELGQAALKVVRAMNEETPMSMGEARENLVEELADVLNMIGIVKVGILTEVENYDVAMEGDRKMDRFRERIEAAEEARLIASMEGPV